MGDLISVKVLGCMQSMSIIEVIKNNFGPIECIKNHYWGLNILKLKSFFIKDFSKPYNFLCNDSFFDP